MYNIWHIKPEHKWIGIFLKRLHSFSWMELTILAIGTFLALALRLSLLSFESADYHIFFQNWYQVMQEQGISAVVSLKYDYTPSYLYLLYWMSVLFPKLDPVVAIKLPSIAFDFLSAYLIFQIVRLKYLHGPAPIFAYFVVLFTPTIVLNSALWGQSDSIYTAFLLMCVYFLLNDDGAYAGVAFGAALAFKLQAIFLAPLLLTLAVKGRLALKHLLWIPLVYLILMIPAWAAGRPLVELLKIYLDQSRSYPFLTLNAPTLYAWLPETLYTVLVPAGMIWAVSLVFLYMLAVFKSRANLSQGLILNLGMLAVLLVPFILPKMHERYFYPADLLSIAFGFFFPEHFFIPIVMGMISFFAYQPFLFGRQLVPLEILAFGVLVILILVTHKAIHALYR
jgi:Gpi18-like mannosyltransferase